MQLCFKPLLIFLRSCSRPADRTNGGSRVVSEDHHSRWHCGKVQQAVYLDSVKRQGSSQAPVLAVLRQMRQRQLLSSLLFVCLLSSRAPGCSQSLLFFQQESNQAAHYQHLENRRLCHFRHTIKRTVSNDISVSSFLIIDSMNDINKVKMFYLHDFQLCLVVKLESLIP